MRVRHEHGYSASCRSVIVAARKRAASPPVTTRWSNVRLSGKIRCTVRNTHCRHDLLVNAPSSENRDSGWDNHGSRIFTGDHAEVRQSDRIAAQFFRGILRARISARIRSSPRRRSAGSRSATLRDWHEEAIRQIDGDAKIDLLQHVAPCRVSVEPCVEPRFGAASCHQRADQPDRDIGMRRPRKNRRRRP